MTTFITKLLATLVHLALFTGIVVVAIYFFIGSDRLAHAASSAREAIDDVKEEASEVLNELTPEAEEGPLQEKELEAGRAQSDQMHEALSKDKNLGEEEESSDMENEPQEADSSRFDEAIERYGKIAKGVSETLKH